MMLPVGLSTFETRILGGFDRWAVCRIVNWYSNYITHLIRLMRVDTIVPPVRDFAWLLSIGSFWCHTSRSSMVLIVVLLSCCCLISGMMITGSTLRHLLPTMRY
jgi:hypothetical protein